jgi:transcriptional regulator GlxA family with amidase domain
VATKPYVDFIRERWADPNLKYVLSVCTGAALVARSGCVDGKRGTSNKFAFAWVKSQREEVKWVGKARWVEDGRWWSSSGVSAGTDMTLGWIEALWGVEKAEEIAKWMEWSRTASGEDPFAVEHGL